MILSGAAFVTIMVYDVRSHRQALSVCIGACRAG
jgi:hypothetical protein